MLEENKFCLIDDFQQSLINKTNNAEAAFVIPSVINISGAPIDNNPEFKYRSIFSPEERLADTCAQLKSLANSHPYYVFEGSRLNLTQIAKLCASMNAGDNSMLVDCSRNKEFFALANLSF